MYKDLTIFCSASGARINWDKSKAIWISKRLMAYWSPIQNFEWVPHGIAIRYLGCQIGVDMPTEAHVAPLLTLLRKNLLHWSHAKLSLAGRVANSVLLVVCAIELHVLKSLSREAKKINTQLHMGRQRSRNF